MPNLYYKHGRYRWFRWRLGKLTLEHMGHSGTVGVGNCGGMWFSILWRGKVVKEWRTHDDL